MSTKNQGQNSRVWVPLSQHMGACTKAKGESAPRGGGSFAGRMSALLLCQAANELF